MGGETAPKKDYSWATYKYSNGDDYNNKFTKYCTDASDGYNGFIDNKTVLEPEDDAATVNWGEDWRMPTDAEWTELREQCTWTWTTQNGINGYQVTSKTNSNSIFLPAAGFRNGTSLYLLETRGYYGSSSLLENYSDNVWIVTFNHEEVYRHSNNRNNGLLVRPVQDKPEEEIKSAYVPKPFTVAEGRQVTFSCGNLQYTQSTDTWAFATRQTDYIGDANITTDTDGNKVLADKIDLFGWGTGSTPADTSRNSDHYQTFVDWGTNSINADCHWEDNMYTLSEWRDMEEAGAVFLPAAGARSKKVSAVQQNGYYWSSTPNNPSTAYVLYFYDQYLYPADYFNRNVGLSVRLVKNYSNVSTDAARPSAAETTPDRKVLRNGQVLILRDGKIFTPTGVEMK